MKFYLPLILLLTISSQAQEFKFKDVPKEELQQKYHPKDSTAPAATLYEKGYLSMYYDNTWKYKLEVTKRMKIYNSDGFDRATVTLPYYYGSSSNYRENITSVKAYVYNIKNDKVTDTKIRNRDIIDEQVSDNLKQVKFTFPELKPGSVIEYTYTKESPFFQKLPEWRFQDEIPVDTSTYELIIPEYFGYNEISKGFHDIYKNTENTYVSMVFRVDNEATTTYGSRNQVSQTGKDNSKAVIYTYTASDIPKLKDEPFVNNHENFMSSIQHEIAYYKNLENNIFEKFTTTWEEVSARLLKSDNFGRELDRTKYYEDDIDEILNNSASQDEKIINIFNHVKNHMTWNNNGGIYTSDKLKKVYEEKVGSVADVNLMLTSMLRYAGVDAHPVLVSTIKNGIPTTVVSSQLFNYVISAIELPNNQYILLDATNPYTSPNLIPTRCLNWHGRLIRSNGTVERIELNPKSASQDNFIMNLKLSEKGSLTGKMRRQYTNQYAYQYRTSYSEVNKKDFVDKMQNNLKISIKEYDVQNMKELSKPVVETMAFEKENAVDVINGKIYMTPLLFLAENENPFKQDQKERKLPINFTFPKSQKYIINIDIPEGYVTEYLPEPIAISLPENKGLYRFNIQKSPTGDLQIIVNRNFNESILGADYYQPLKDFYKNIVNKETDKIVLSKI